MFDNKYPYTDFHELNLDWFMGEFKKLVAEWEETKGEWNTLHDYVQNYFENLNVQTEINNKINAMILDGTFADIVSPFVTAALPALVAGQLPDVVAAQISAVVAAQISAVVADQLPAVAATAAAAEVGDWLAAHIDPDTGYVIDDTLTVSQAAADALTVGEKFNVIDGEFSNMTIENYTLSRNRSVNISAYVVNNKYVSASPQNNPTTISYNALSGYKYYDVPVDAANGYKYIATCFSGTIIRGIIFTDADDTLIDYLPKPYTPSPGATITTEVFTIPSGCTRILINQGSTPAALTIVNAMDFTLTTHPASPIASTSDNRHYTVGTGDIVHEVDLQGSNNGTVNYSTLKYNGSTFKNVADDIAPVSITGPGYVGANHGYNFGYECTCTAHGLTNSNIGELYDDGSAKYVLLKIINANKLLIGHYATWNWWRLTTGAPTFVVFGGISLTVESSSLVQIYPSVKNINVSIVRNDSNIFELSESYDIIDMGTSVDALIANVGNNDNDSLLSLSDALITVRNLYTFNNTGALLLTQNLKVNKNIQIGYYGGSQSMPFGSSDKIAVSQSNLNSLQNTGDAQITFSKTGWDDSSTPPAFYLQVNNADTSLNKAFIQAFVNISNRSIDTSAGFCFTTRKMYPYLIQPAATTAAGVVYNAYTLRLPVAGITNSDTVFVNSITRGDVGYMAAVIRSSGDYTVPVPDEFAGKSITVAMQDGCTVNNIDIINGIDVTASRAYAYLIITCK